MKILVDSHGRPLKSSEGFYAENFSYLEDVRDAIGEVQGEPCTADNDELADTVRSMDRPLVYEVGSTTVRTSASATANYATNGLIGIVSAGGNAYSLAQWNRLFVDAGYSTAEMPVPKAFFVTKANGKREAIDFDYFTGVTYNPTGDTAGAANKLQLAPYNNLAEVKAAANGTDFTTNKAWSITADGDEWVLYEANTKQSFCVPGTVAYGNARCDSDNFDLYTEMQYQICEWMRHRMAIDSGLSTSKADGTMGEIAIYNSSGAQAAAGEDMYFWIKNDSNVWTNTNKPAKYNINNRHATASYEFTSAYQDTVYAAQKTAGINMDDTGVNSASKPVLCPGAKGSECIAVDGKWMIITPFVTYANNTARIPDAPAVYYIKSIGKSLPSQEAIELWFFNKTLVTAIRNYLVNVEGRSIPALINDAIWCAGRYSAANGWYVATTYGYRVNVVTSYRFCVVGSSGLSAE